MHSLRPCRWRAAIGVLLALPLMACQPRSITPAQDADLRAVFDQLQRGDLTRIDAAFDPQFHNPEVAASLPGLKALIPPSQPQIQRLNAASETDKQGRLNYGASYEYDYPGVGLLTQVEMRQDAKGRKTITALRVVRAPQPHLVDHYRFGLVGKMPFQYAFLALMALAPLLGVWGIVAVWRAPDPPRKWKPLWTLAMAIGFMDLKMNWADGVTILKVDSLHILYVTAAKFSPVSPWMLSTSLPLASIAFLIGYRPAKTPRL
jgi:hypothetical protein